MGKKRRVGYSDVMSTLAMFMALAGGSIAIASVAKDEVGTREVENESLKSKDLKDGKAVESGDIVDDEVGAQDIGADAVGASEVASNAIGTSEVALNALTGSDINEATLDVVVDSLNTFPHGRMTAGAPQSVADGIVTQIAFDNANPLGQMTFDAATDSLTITEAGVYSVFAELGWAANATGRRSVRIVVDGTSEAADTVQAVDSATAGTRLSVATVLRLDAGDVLTMEAQQTSGGDLFTNAATGDFAALSAAWVSQP
jgi:hypothetical protein